jgi:hypothetical protein
LDERDIVKIMNKHYYIAIIVEFSAAAIMGIGLIEKLVYGKCNPAGLLISAGSLIGFLGAMYFAKFAKKNDIF